MLRARAVILAALAVSVSPLRGQAPTSALWTVAATPLAVPPALAGGASGAFWNPAQRELETASVLLHVDVIDTPPELGMIGVLAGVSTEARDLGHLSLTYGRVSVGDLVRTSTNPSSREGTIEVYTQAIGIAWSRRVSAVRLGVTARLLTDRLDDLSTSEWGLDVGMGWDPTEWLRLAGATQFLAPFGPGFDHALLYTGVEARGWRGTLGGIPAALLLRVGSATIGDAGTDVILGFGIVAAGRVSLDVAAANETSFGERAWRTKFGLSARVGRYAVMAGLAGGIGDIGTTLRMGLQGGLR